MESEKFCDIGKRELNEDYALIYEERKAGVYVVADGLGGHKCGEVASETAALTMREAFCANPQSSSEAMRELFEKAQNELLKKAREPEYSGMRTTAVALAICGNIAVWGNVGDSRLYHIRNGAISSVTADHSVAYISYLNGEIKYDDIRNSPDQNRLIRSMGNEDKFKPDISEPLEVIEGDAFLLCTDGFWEYITEKEILSAYKKSATASRWLAKMVRVVEKNGKANPERDNCTAVTVFV